MHHTPFPFEHIYPGLNLKKMLRLSVSPTRGVGHIGLRAVLFMREKIKRPLPAACSSHRALPVAVGLLFRSWGSPFILPVVPGAPALPKTFVATPSLAGTGLPRTGAVGVSLSWWYAFKSLTNYVFPTRASKVTGLSG